MPNVTYPWNPFQDMIDADITGEIIKAPGATGMEFVPRAAPFFGNKFNLYKQGSNAPLVLGVDYTFAHPFDLFIDTYQRNVFGSVILLKPSTDTLLADYSTIGGPFVLDAAAFAVLVANIMNSPRRTDWTMLTNVPTAFPPDPHKHPALQTYDYLEMMTYLRALINAISTTSGGVSLQSMLEDHIKKALPQAHTATKSDLALSDVQNMAAGVTADLAGQSANKTVTIALLKEALRQFSAGSLPLN